MGKIKNKFTNSYFNLIVIIACIVPLSCDFSFDNIILDKLTSPDSMYMVYVFNRDAGATSGFNTQVSILRSKEKFNNRPGNTFICDSDHGKVDNYQKYSNGGPLLVFNWISNNTLEINYPKGTRIFKMEDTIGNIIIEYSEY